LTALERKKWADDVVCDGSELISGRCPRRRCEEWPRRIPTLGAAVIPGVEQDLGELAEVDVAAGNDADDLALAGPPG